MEYSKKEIETIVNGCNTEVELMDICLGFQFLVDNNYQTKTLHLNLVAHLKLQQLINKS